MIESSKVDKGKDHPHIRAGRPGNTNVMSQIIEVNKIKKQSR